MIGGIQETFDITLVRDSDGKEIHLTVVANEQGAPDVRLGSSEKEAAQAGQIGTIRIDSLHQGAGQHVARNPLKYESANGMIPFEGFLQAVDGAAPANTDVNVSFTSEQLRSGVFRTPAGVNIMVWPEGITESTAPGTIVSSPPASHRFTGSFVRYGNHTFFGVESTGASQASGDVRARTDGGSYLNLSFTASFLVRVGTRLFRVRQDLSASVLKAFVSWTDDPNTTTPTWSTPEYELPLGLGMKVTDVAALGPHLLIAVSSTNDIAVYVVDTDGNFTDILPEGIETGTSGLFMPFAGGVVLFIGGRPQAVLFRDITDTSILDFNLASQPADTTGWALSPGLGAVTTADSIFVPIQLTSTALGAAGFFIVQGQLGPDGWSVRPICPVDRTGAAEAPLGARTSYSNGLRTLSYISKDDVDHKRFDIIIPDTGHSNGPTIPANCTLRTSRYNGGVWVTKKFLRARGYLLSRAGGGAVNSVKFYLDGSNVATAPYTSGSNPTGPFIHDLGDSVIGRDIAVDFIQVSGVYACRFELPFEIDFFFVPDQIDTVRVAVVAGESVTPGGTLDRRHKLHVLDVLEDMVKNPSVWTLKWRKGGPGQGRVNWKVIPLRLNEAETEPIWRPGAGSAVAVLTLQRI